MEEQFLDRLLDEYDLVARPEDLLELYAKLGVDTSKSEVSPNCEFWCDRTRMRCENREHGILDSIETRVGDHEIELDFANDQAVLYLTGGSTRRKRYLAEFRTVPEFAIPTLQILRVNTETITVTNIDRSLTMAIDRPTGIVTEYVYTGKGGKPSQWIAQRAVVTHPGEIHFPHVHVTASYEMGALSTVETTLILDVSFNQDIPDERWQVSTTPTTKIWDARRTNTPMRFRGRHAVSDVAAFVEGTQRPRSANVTWWFSLCASAAVVLIAIVILQMRRRHIAR